MASFNYVAGRASDVLLANPFEGDGFWRNQAAGAIREAEHRVENGRLDPELVHPDGGSLTRRGFCLLRHESAVRDFYDEQQVTGTYYSEVVAMARRLTGAEAVGVVSHVLRHAGDKTKNPGEGAIRGGAYFVHNDFSDSLKEQFLARYGEAQPNILAQPPLCVTEDALRRGRLVALNFWRPLATTPLRHAPLGVVDATSLSRTELHPFAHSPSELPPHYALPTPIYVTLAESAAAHRWFWFPGMTRDEALVIKTYDSAGQVPANGVALHSAFDTEADPSGVPGAPLRESIEARVLCFIPSDDPSRQEPAT